MIFELFRLFPFIGSKYLNEIKVLYKTQKSVETDSMHGLSTLTSLNVLCHTWYHDGKAYSFFFLY